MLLGELRRENVEEYWNVVTHGLGVILAIIGGLYLFSLTTVGGHNYHFPAVVIFSVSMLMVYTSSVLYHYNHGKPFRKVYRTIDHICIYYLIAGTYTPFLLISYPEQVGWKLLMVLWSLAFLGTIFKFFYTGRFEKISVFLYLFLGWFVLVDLNTFLDSIHSKTLYLSIAGGLLYCIGVIFYVRKRPMDHVFWHVFVLLGNACHYFAVVSIL